MNRRVLLVVAAAWLLVHPAAARADVFHGVTFPGGAASFADEVVSYAPVLVGGHPQDPWNIPASALGIPDYPETRPGHVSLGDGGSLVVRFTNNSLTGNGTSALDLWIFEVGPDVEDTFVWISKDGIDWLSVGKVFGSTSGIDVDAFGVHAGNYYSFVKLQDDGSEGAQSGDTVGADIDAIGAISSAPPVSVPEPLTMWLLGIGAAAVLRRRG